MSRNLVFISCLLLLSVNATSLPQVNAVVSGSANIETTSEHMNIQQNSDLLHMQFDHLNIGVNESVHFEQSINNLAIAESLSSDPTQVYGSLSADAGLFVVSPSGLIIHEGGVIDAGSLALGIGNLSVMDSNEYSFKETGSSIVNSGNLFGNSITVFSQSFINENLTKAYGDIAINTAEELLLSVSGDQFSYVVDQATAQALIENSGEIIAEGGNVIVDAQTQQNLHNLSIHNLGEIRATQVLERGGDVYLLGGDGDIENEGVIVSDALEANYHGGNILIESNRIAQYGEIEANGVGAGDGGKVVLTADSVVSLMPDSVIRANAGAIGKGGFVQAFSPKLSMLRPDALIEAKGGTLYGDGGFVDVSGWEYIEVDGFVDTSAYNGSNGLFLIDPYNVTISAGANNNVSFGSNTYTPTNSGAIINVTTLEGQLAAGNVQVVTTGAGAESGDISVSVPIDLDGTNGNTLTLTADGSIIINGSIEDGTPGTADATSIVLQASGNITMTDGTTLDTGGGVMTLTSSGNISVSNLITDGSNLFVTAVNVTDAGDTGTYDIQTSGGTAFFNVIGDIGGTGWGTALEVADTHFDFTFGNPNSNVYLDAGLSTAELEIVGLDYDGGGGLDFNMRSTNGADIRVSGRMEDSNTGSVETSTFNLSTNLVGGDIIINDGAAIRSEGGDITLLAGGGMWLSEVWSAGGAVNLTATNMIDNGTAASDINSGGTGIVTVNLSGDFGGTSSATGIEVNNAIVDFNASGTNQNFYMRTDSNQDLTIRDIDYNGTGNFVFNYDRTGTGDVVLSGDIFDGDSAGDSATINISTSGIGSDIRIQSGAEIRSRGGNIDFGIADSSSTFTMNGNGIVRSQGGNITINSAGNANVTYLKSDGGNINLTAQQITDAGNTRNDLVADGGTITINASGDVGGINSSTALEVENAVINYTASGTNQNVFLNGVGANDITLNNIEYDGTGTFNLGVQHTGTGDLLVTGQITDSAAGSADVATINFETTNVDSDIILSDGATVRSYGGDITYNSDGWIGIVRTKTDGGDLYLTAGKEIYDNGNTGPDIETLGGTVFITSAADVGTIANGSIEIRDSIISGNLLANNLTWDFRAYAATNYNSIGNIDLDGGNGFSLFLHNNNGGEVRVVGNVEDSNTGTADQATISLQTLIGGDQIVMSDGTLLNTYGGTITFNSAATIGLAQLISGSGAINITSTGNIYDNNVTGSEFYSSGGVVTINAGGNIGLNATTGAIEVRDSVFDVNFSQPNQNAWFNVKASNGYMNIRDVDFNGADGSLFYVEADNGSDIIVSGQMYDSDTGVQDDASVNLITTTGDITINDGSTIRVGNGDVTLNSGNDLYFTGLLGGSVSNLIAVNNIIDNGSITLDISTTGIVNMSAGGSVGLVGGDTVFDFSGGTYNMTMGAGDWDIIASGVVNLNNIEIDGANGSELKFLTTSDLNLTGVMTDANGTDDRVNLYLGASAPGFIVFPDAGYTVLGSLTFWDGTSGIRDGTDERIRLTADDVIISGNTFLNNTGTIAMDLTVDRLDLTHAGANRDFFITNTKDLQLVELDGDGSALAGQSFRFDVQGTLFVPNNSGLNNVVSVADQLWITAQDFQDPDADNVVSIIESSTDADADMNLILELTAASTLELRTNANFFDGSVVAGSDVTVDVTAGELSLANDLNGDGFFVTGDGNWTFLSNNTVRLNDVGLSSTGNYQFNVGDLLDSDGNLTVTANQLFVNLSAPSLTTYDFNLTVNEFDAANINTINVNQGADIRFVDVNGDGSIFNSVQSLSASIGGQVVLADAGFTISNVINMAATDFIDSDGFINLSANQIYLDYTSPSLTDYGITGTISQLNASVAANLQVSSDADMSIVDWNGSGSILAGATGLDLRSSGRLSIPSVGLSATNYLWLTGLDVEDGDHNLVGLNTDQLLINSGMSADNLTLAGTFNDMDVTLSGFGANLVLNYGQDLNVLDVNNDGSSLAISDGFAAIINAGGVSLSDSISITDTLNNGQSAGYLYIEYEGNSLFGIAGNLQLTLDSAADASVDAGFGMGTNKLYVRQVGAANAGNLMAFSNANIQVIGGDAYFDIANGGAVDGYGSINMATNASITAINTVGESTNPQPGYADLTLPGSLLVGDNRQIIFNGYTLVDEAPEDPEVPDLPELGDQIDQGISDAINDSVDDTGQMVVDEIQEETVAAVESSPNVNFALNEMFSGCREGNSRDTRCKVKEEISRFLGRFLIGGSMPKTVR